MELRDYQQDMYDKIRDELKTHQGVCGVLPCRAGKSWIMKKIVENDCLKGYITRTHIYGTYRQMVADLSEE